jgi:hypothetical protein
MEVIADGKHGLAGGRHGNGLEEFIETECVGDLKTAKGMLVWNPTVCSEAQKAKASFLRKQWGTRCLERENKNREIGRATRLLYPAPREKCFLLRLPFIEAGQKIALLVSRSTRVMFPTLREPAKGWATQRLFSLFEWIT